MLPLSFLPPSLSRQHSTAQSSLPAKHHTHASISPHHGATIPPYRTPSPTTNFSTAPVVGAHKMSISCAHLSSTTPATCSLPPLSCHYKPMLHAPLIFSSTITLPTSLNHSELTARRASHPCLHFTPPRCHYSSLLNATPYNQLLHRASY
jgi:hypothetical protein